MTNNKFMLKINNKNSIFKQIVFQIRLTKYRQNYLLKFALQTSLLNYCSSLHCRAT